MNTRAKSRFRLVYTSLWGDATFRSLSRMQPSTQALWLYLTTGPHTTGLEGLFQATEVGLAHKLGWTLEDFRICWAEIDHAGWGRADWDADVVWLPRLIGDGKPDNHKVVIGWESLVAGHPRVPAPRRSVRGDSRQMRIACARMRRRFGRRGQDSHRVAHGRPPCIRHHERRASLPPWCSTGCPS